AVGGDAGGFGGDLLGLIEKIAREHATVGDDHGDARRAIVEHDALGEDRIEGFVGNSLFEHSIDDDGEFGGGDVDGGCAGAEFCSVSKSGQSQADQQSQNYPRHGILRSVDDTAVEKKTLTPALSRCTGRGGRGGSVRSWN